MELNARGTPSARATTTEPTQPEESELPWKMPRATTKTQATKMNTERHFYKSLK